MSEEKNKTAPHINCLYAEEKSELLINVNELSKKVDVLYRNITEPIELKNGTTHHKTQAEAIKDSWERINHIQEHLVRLDTRTQVLEDVQKLVQSYKETKTRTSRIVRPIWRFLYKSAIAVIGLYIFIMSLHYLFQGEYREAIETIKPFIGL